MAEIVSSVKNPKLRDMMGIFGMFNEEKDKKSNSDLLLQTKKKSKNVHEAIVRCSSSVFHFLERDHLLSRIPANRTVSFRQSKK